MLGGGDIYRQRNTNFLSTNMTFNKIALGRHVCEHIQVAHVALEKVSL